jgi:hypothetical protein
MERQMSAKYCVAAAAAATLYLGSSASLRAANPYVSAYDLNRYCAAPDQTIDNALCVWFITGALEVIVNNRSYGFSVCPPHMINSAQAVKLTRLWLAAHPDPEVRAGSSAVAAAVAAAFPCKK